jgi:hypothetical protein
MSALWQLRPIPLQNLHPHSDVLMLEFYYYLMFIATTLPYMRVNAFKSDNVEDYCNQGSSLR